jgi:ribosomal protein L16 Arg81 hydroxylase
MRRVLLGFMDEETTKHMIDSSYDIYGFFFDNLKSMISDLLILNEPKKKKISKGLQDDKFKRETVDDENEEQSNEIIRTENENKKMKERLKNEYLMCVKTQRKLNTYGENKLASNKYNDKKTETDCNFDNLKSYLKYKI